MSNNLEGIFMEKENIIINEQSYQQFKKDMCKTNDYFTLEEWKILVEKINTFLTL